MSLKIPLDPKTKSELALRLYRNVKNTAELRAKLADGSLPCCMVRPSTIVDPFIVAVAANKATLAEKTTTKNLYTEILYNLSASKNISQSLRQFGVDDSDTDVLVVQVVPVNGGLEDVPIDGDEVDVAELRALTDTTLVRKVYKLNDDEVKGGDVVAAVCNRIAIKDFK